MDNISQLVCRLLDGVTDDKGDHVTIEISKGDFREIILSLGAAIQYKKENSENETLKDALMDYHEQALAVFKSAQTEAEGLRKAKKAFGWSFKKPVNKGAVFWDYIKLITGNYDLETKTETVPISKTEAVEKIRQKYELASWEAAYKQIQQAIKDRKVKFGDEGYKGLLPPNWPDG